MHKCTLHHTMCCRWLLQVVVATPGRLWDLMREGHRHVTDLSHLSFLVIDEAGELSLA